MNAFRFHELVAEAKRRGFQIVRTEHKDPAELHEGKLLFIHQDEDTGANEIWREDSETEFTCIGKIVPLR